MNVFLKLVYQDCFVIESMNRAQSSFYTTASCHIRFSIEPWLGSITTASSIRTTRSIPKDVMIIEVVKVYIKRILYVYKHQLIQPKKIRCLYIAIKFVNVALFCNHMHMHSNAFTLNEPLLFGCHY